VASHAFWSVTDASPSYHPSRLRIGRTRPAREGGAVLVSYATALLGTIVATEIV